MKLESSRTYLNVRVGKYHSAECYLHVRRQDLEWFNLSHQQNFKQIFHLLSTSILPRMFSDEVEESHAKITKKKRPPTMLGPGGVPLDLGERHAATKPTASNQQSTLNNPNKRKRGKGAGVAAAAAKKVAVEKKLLESKHGNETGIYYAFGNSIQLTYHLIDENPKEKTKPGVTLVFHEKMDDQKNQEDGGKNKGSFRHLIKLSKRIILWCYPYDPAHPNEPDPEGGMPRPEMIPLSDLFREPYHQD